MASASVSTVSTSPMAPPAAGSSATEHHSSPNSHTDKAEDSSFLSSDTGDNSMLRHPKGKRKRTAAKDKIILEAAYVANPKPDKLARLEVVEQVSLSEKEVQIWFQNRRQNDRRKSRPLTAQEIAALRYGGGIHSLSADPSHFRASLSQQSQHSQHSPFSSDAHSSSPPHHPHFNSTSMMPTVPPTTTPHTSPEIGPWASNVSANGSKVGGPFASSAGSVGYLANRWNAHRDEPYRTASPVLPPPTEQPKPQPMMQRPYRLRLSLEGKAEVMPSQSPSPPRRLPLPHPSMAQDRRGSYGSEANGNDALGRPGLGRSHSAASAASTASGFTLPPISSLTSVLASGPSIAPMAATATHPPRLLRGRSRDVHAWESVCDAETRVDDELSAHAENEASGSAIAAISLLRSSSGSLGSMSAMSSMSTMSMGAVLQPNGSRRNALALTRPSPKRAKLGRTMSSAARLPGQSQSAAWVDDDKKKKLKLSTILSAAGDSDKENWSPDSEGRPASTAPMTTTYTHPRRTALPGSRNGPGTTPRAMLGESKTFHANVRPAPRPLASGKADGIAIFEDAPTKGDKSEKGDKTDKTDNSAPVRGTPVKRLHLSRATTLPADDVERFMRSGASEVSPSKKGDLDCVAGLLSLAQGAWR